MQRNISEYTVLTSTRADGLSITVNKYIGDGWQPYLNLNTIEYGNSQLFAQAMVKYAEPVVTPSRVGGYEP